MKTDIEARMSQYEEGGIEFAILALVKDPLDNHVQDLARGAKSLQIMSVRMDETKPDWRDFLGSSRRGDGDPLDGSFISGPAEIYTLPQEVINNTILSDEMKHQLTTGDTTQLMERRQKLVDSQYSIQMSILAELESHRADEDKAKRRCFDYTPFIMAWLRIHARKGVIQEIIDSAEE